jgi:hypothetical protein
VVAGLAWNTVYSLVPDDDYTDVHSAEDVEEERAF